MCFGRGRQSGGAAPLWYWRRPPHTPYTLQIAQFRPHTGTRHSPVQVRGPSIDLIRPTPTFNPTFKPYTQARDFSADFVRVVAAGLAAGVREEALQWVAAMAALMREADSQRLHVLGREVRVVQGQAWD